MFGISARDLNPIDNVAIPGTHMTRHATTGSRSVEMISRNYNPKPVSDTRFQSQRHVSSTFCVARGFLFIHLLSFTMHLLFALLLILPLKLLGAGLPEFGDDKAADAYFREKSATFRKMAESVDRLGGYDIVTAESVSEPTGQVPVLTGMAHTQEGRRKIELNPKLIGPERWSILIFELTNHAQEEHHQAINREAREGKLSGPDEYGILRQLVEFDGLRIHRQVLEEVEAAAGPLPSGFFSSRLFPWAGNAKKLSEYHLPSAYQLIHNQDQSGHRAYYKRHYHFICASVPLESKVKR
ncbi:MAG: hypothetical protein RLZZ553_812 [Verrucomicrobiota bacterium]